MSCGKSFFLPFLGLHAGTAVGGFFLFYAKMRFLAEPAIVRGGIDRLREIDSDFRFFRVKKFPNFNSERFRQALNRIQANQPLSSRFDLLIKLVAHAGVFGELLLRQPGQGAELLQTIGDGVQIIHSTNCAVFDNFCSPCEWLCKSLVFTPNDW